jgi:hypothetical protein
MPETAAAVVTGFSNPWSLSWSEVDKHITRKGKFSNVITFLEEAFVYVLSQNRVL